MRAGIIAEISEAIDKLLTNKPILTLDGAEDGDTSFEDKQGKDELWEKMLKLQEMQQELQHFSIGLSKGELATKPPPRGNYMAAGLKQLQMHLRHLSWQTQRISEGDYSQKVDFMGEFSEAFNKMISQLETRENNILTQRETMLRVFDQIEPVFIVSADEPYEVLYANKMAKLRFHMDNEDQARQDFLRSFRDKREIQSSRQIQDPATGRWYRISCEQFFWERELDSLLYYCVDITAHVQRENDLEHEAHTDKLTGLNNRYAFERSYDILWDTCRQNRSPLSIIMFDIDHFKNCNDAYGHIHGDRCLGAFAEALRAHIGRFNDVVARFGGEEFVALLPYTSEKAAVKIAEIVRKVIEETDIPICEAGCQQPPTMRITVSGGVASTIPKFDKIPEELLSAADKALYQAKQTGRNKICTVD